MWWIIGLAGLALLAKIIQDWGWERGWTKGEIGELPKSPGVYILHYPNLKERIYIGETNDLRWRLYEHRKKLWRTFDWYQTRSKLEGKCLERRLKGEVRE